jgi:hypothetical protein
MLDVMPLNQLVLLGQIISKCFSDEVSEMSTSGKFVGLVNGTRSKL